MATPQAKQSGEDEILYAFNFAVNNINFTINDFGDQLKSFLV